MLRIYLLGNFRVERDGVAIPAEAWARRKTKALLKLVALHPKRQIHKEQVMDLLWPDLDPTSARDNFYRNLSFLRHILEPDLKRPADSHFLTLSAEILALGSSDHVWVDVGSFERLLNQARTASSPEMLLSEAMYLYVGDLLPEDAYEDWAVTRRDSLRRAAIKALFQLAEAHRNRGDFEQAIDTLQRLLSIESTEEQAHRELMLAFTLAGQRQDALRQFDRCVRVMKAELGIEPDSETVGLYERIVGGEIAQAPKTVSTKQGTQRVINLPQPGTPLIGREHEVEEACRHLHRPDVRLLTFTGTAGIGKTRLAIEVANAVANDFADGVLFVPLAPIPDADLVLPAITRALDLHEHGDRSLLEMLKMHLRDKQLLIVLDNYEQVISSAPLLAEVLSAAPQVRMLVTSRELLRLTIEHDFPVAPLALPDMGKQSATELASGCASMQLFAARAGSVKAGFVLSAENARTIAEICHRLDGIPLALELAAARVRSLTLQAILSRLSSRLRLLTGGARDLPTRQQTLLDAIGWSYELLKPSERTIFTRFSVFSGGCLEEAAREVCYESGSESALDDLALLQDKSLLWQAEAQSGEPRFTMLETIREFAMERLEENGERGATEARHAHYYLKIAEAGEAVWFSVEQHYWLNRFDEERYNFQATLTWTLENEPDMALRLCGALWRYWLAHGYLTEGRHWLGEAISLVPKHSDGTARSDRAARAKALFGAGVLAIHQSDYANAQELVAQSLGIARDLGDPEQTANSLIALGINAHYRGDYTSAVMRYEEALPIFRSLKHPRGAALTLNSLSNSVLCLGDPERAATLAQESLALSQGSGDSLSVAASLANLGLALLEHGERDRSIKLLEESLELRRRLKDKGGIAHTLYFLGLAALSLGELEQARALCAESLSLRAEMGDREGVAAPLEGLAAVAAACGMASRAARLYGAASSLRKQIGAPMPPYERMLHDAVISAAREHIGELKWAGEWKAGSEMSTEEAVTSALSLSD